MPEVRVPAPLAHQLAIDLSPARFKVARWGRRTGKTVWAFKGAMVGHGPGQPDAPRWRGVAQGFDVYWIGPDYPQTSILWHTEIKPRFDRIPGVHLDNSDFDVRFPTGGVRRLRGPSDEIDSRPRSDRPLS